MRTDLILNYSHLEEVVSRLREYIVVVDNLETSIGEYTLSIEAQRSEGFQQLYDKIKNINTDIDSNKNKAMQMANILESYIEDMRHHARERQSGYPTRVDTIDIIHNLGQIEGRILHVKKETCYKIPEIWHIALTEEEKEEEEKYKRNYKRVEKYQSGSLAIFMSQLQEKIHEMEDIYDIYLKKFENEDDEYRGKINQLYKETTSVKDKWNNFWSMVESVTISFTKALATVIISVLVIKAIMLIPYGLVVLGVGVGIMYFTPKEYVPKCLSDPKEVVDGVIGSCKEIIKEPLGAVEAMGQGLMDTIQTPEGVASVAGTITGMYLSPKLDKLFSKGSGALILKECLKGRK